MPCFKVIMAGGVVKFGAMVQRTEDGVVYLHTLAGVVEELQPDDILAVELAVSE